jgi:hypothetical protein
MQVTPLTPFFPAHVQPAYKGVYKTEIGSYRYFDGKNWYVGAYDGPMRARKAYENNRLKANAVSWQGVAVKPKSFKG